MGGALESLLQSFIQNCITEGGDLEKTIHSKLKSIHDLVDGHDFANVVISYFRGYDNGDDNLKNCALRWIKGEYTTKTEANRDLGVRTIIEDVKVYDYIKLLAHFSVLAGRSGIVVLFDEMVNLYKLSNTKARNNNYEQILRIINDLLQGNVKNIGFVMGGTPDFLTDPYRGLYSYEALKSRLEENRFAVNGLIDLNSPVIRLQSLTPEDLFILLTNIRNVFAFGDESKYLVPNEALEAFMNHCNKKIGASYFKTPRNTIKEFVSMLSILEQNPGTKWQDLLGVIDIKDDISINDAFDISGDDSDLVDI